MQQSDSCDDMTSRRPSVHTAQEGQAGEEYLRAAQDKLVTSGNEIQTQSISITDHAVDDVEQYLQSQLQQLTEIEAKFNRSDIRVRTEISDIQGMIERGSIEREFNSLSQRLDQEMQRVQTESLALRALNQLKACSSQHVSLIVGQSDNSTIIKEWQQLQQLRECTAHFDMDLLNRVNMQKAIQQLEQTRKFVAKRHLIKELYKLKSPEL
ncbi:hypothetical protein MIR68_006157 [Amoeboaphelidium protococcarum]|nr:hypothetical protein MIR68_006157 [Amoeboaphelidium protococcarum]KAI3648328.1 hypothetical protein MP228_006182 [Amoeboaphelidium protococcarum]KAI3651415.1 hypothetical protein MP228_003686 [Amoeboaphelidium protococcarum]